MSEINSFDELLTRDDVGRIAGISYATVSNWTKAGHIPTVDGRRMGEQLRYSDEAAKRALHIAAGRAEGLTMREALQRADRIAEAVAGADLCPLCDGSGRFPPGIHRSIKATRKGR